MPSLFEKRDPWGHGMALWVLVGMVFLLPIAFFGLRKIDLHNDVQNWLPKDDPQAQTLAWYQSQFPIEDRVIVSWKGSSMNDHRVHDFARLIVGEKDKQGQRHKDIKYVKEVVTPHDIIARIRESGGGSGGKVGQAEMIRRMEGVLVGTGKLKVALTPHGQSRQKTVERLIVENLKSELNIDATIVGPQKAVEWSEDDIDEENPPEEFPMPDRHDLQVAWRGMQPGTDDSKAIRKLIKSLLGRKTKQHPEGEPLVESTFYFPGSPVAIYITLNDAGKEEPKRAFAAIRRAAKDVGIPEEDFHMGGRPVATAELNRQVKRSAWNRDYSAYLLHRRSPILLSLIVGVALSFLLLRSARLAILVLVTGVFTVIITVALVPYTNGSMNMVLVVMPTLLYVLTISAAIHVANYWKHAAHRNVRTAVVEAVKTARVPCLLAGATTAIGLLSLTTSPLRPVRDFGMYSAIGCAVSLLAVLVCLPAMLQFWPAKGPEKRELERRGWRMLAGLISKQWIPVSLVSIAAFVVCTMGLKHFRTETKVIRYFPQNSPVVKDYHYLEDNLAGIIPIDVIVRFDKNAMQERNIIERMEIVRKIEEKLRKHPEISGVIALPDFRPGNETLEDGRLPEPSGRLELLKRNRTIFEMNKQTRAKDSKARTLLVVAKNDSSLKMEDGREFKVEKGDELWRITAQVSIMSDANYGDLTAKLNTMVQETLRYQPGADHVVTGMVPVFLRTQQAVLSSLITSFALAFGVIAIVLMVVLKNPVSGLITMLPNLMPVGIVFGLISWLGVAVDIGTMITASVALGIAVDGTLHLLSWFKEGIANGLSRSEAIEKALMHCGPAMWQTSAAVGIGLLMLAPAELLLISRFGWLMASLIGAALIADIIFLPALLAGPLGYIIERGILRSHKPGEASTEDSEPLATGASPEPHIVKMQKEDGRVLRVD